MPAIQPMTQRQFLNAFSHSSHFFLSWSLLGAIALLFTQTMSRLDFLRLLTAALFKGIKAVLQPSGIVICFSAILVQMHKIRSLLMWKRNLSCASSLCKLFCHSTDIFLQTGWDASIQIQVCPPSSPGSQTQAGPSYCFSLS